jgi:cation diffusion facilitator CzcD-associated flavoprotein CzcO
LSNDYYPTLCRPDVELVTTPITEVRPHAVVTADGREHPADVLVYGTGFHVTDSVGKLDVTGTGGLTLADAWADGMRAYLGVTVAGFPNLYLLVGPNSGLGHNSMVFMIESQIRYVMQALRLGAERVAVRADVQDAYNDGIQRRLRRGVWQVGGCRSWYLDAHGANRTLWPGFCTGYWRRTRRLRPADYDTT